MINHDMLIQGIAAYDPRFSRYHPITTFKSAPDALLYPYAHNGNIDLSRIPSLYLSEHAAHELAEILIAKGICNLSASFQKGSPGIPILCSKLAGKVNCFIFPTSPYGYPCGYSEPPKAFSPRQAPSPNDSIAPFSFSPIQSPCLQELQIKTAVHQLLATTPPSNLSPPELQAFNAQYNSQLEEAIQRGLISIDGVLTFAPSPLFPINLSMYGAERLGRYLANHPEIRGLQIENLYCALKETIEILRDHLPKKRFDILSLQKPKGYAPLLLNNFEELISGIDAKVSSPTLSFTNKGANSANRLQTPPKSWGEDLSTLLQVNLSELSKEEQDSWTSSLENALKKKIAPLEQPYPLPTVNTVYISRGQGSNYLGSACHNIKPDAAKKLCDILHSMAKQGLIQSVHMSISSSPEVDKIFAQGLPYGLRNLYIKSNTEIQLSEKIQRSTAKVLILKQAAPFKTEHVVIRKEFDPLTALGLNNAKPPYN